MAISLRPSVNGTPVTVSVEPHTLLVQLLREYLRLTGMHVGCDTAQCGAHTMYIDGRAVKSCNILVVQADGVEVTTIKGLSKDGVLHPMQEAFRQCHGPQCGSCTPDIVMTATTLATQHPRPDEHTVREQLDDNPCRCTGYHNVVHAVMHGVEVMAEAQGDDASLRSSAAARAHVV